MLENTIERAPALSLDARITAQEDTIARPIPKGARSPAKGMAQMRKGHAENELRTLKAS
jgi:hypothetical protein